MDVAEALDREVIVERAEALRFWLLGLGLSGRATGAIQRELGAIIDDGSDRSLYGRRSLAGLTVADFTKALHSPNGGAVGRVKSVGDGALKELRAAIPAKSKAPRSPRKTARAQASEAKPSRRRRAAPDEPQPTGEGTASVIEAVAPETGAPEVVTEALQADVPPEAQAAPRRRGRPKGSKKTAQPGAEAHQEAPAPAQAPKRPRGRPRRSEAPVEAVARAQATNGVKPAASRAATVPVAAFTETQAAPAVSDGDLTLDELRQLWPSLHPHARRAVVLYTSELLIEAPNEE